jgi:hypothetical protein
MSGGSLDYAYARVEDAAAVIRSRASSATHVAFADHLDLVAKALRDVEWVFSGDKGQGDDTDSILACIRLEGVLVAAIKRAESARCELDGAIWLAKK